MIVTYRPSGETPQRWTFDPKAVISGEAEAIEKRVAMTWDEFQKAILGGSIAARRVLLWHLLKREHPPLRLDDVSFRTGEVEVEFEKCELVDLRAQLIRRDRMVSEEDRDRALRAIDAQITDLESREMEPGEPGNADDADDALGKAI